jgi:hypothetical protein
MIYDNEDYSGQTEYTKEWWAGKKTMNEQHEAAMAGGKRRISAMM